MIFCSPIYLVLISLLNYLLITCLRYLLTTTTSILCTFVCKYYYQFLKYFIENIPTIWNQRLKYIGNNYSNHSSNRSTTLGLLNSIHLKASIHFNVCYDQIVSFWVQISHKYKIYPHIKSWSNSPQQDKIKTAELIETMI